MWEAYGMKNKDFLWAGTVFMGGIAGQQDGPCGAVSGGALVLGLKNSLAKKGKDEAKKAREDAYKDAEEFVKSFRDRFGSITCFGLLGVDFNDEAAMKKAKEEGIFDGKCTEHVKFAIEKLYEIEEKHNRSDGK
jgi:C_GCAxxG_C_C family probable redox protein